MSLAEKVDRWIEAALRRIYKSIDRRVEYEKGERPRETVNRSTGQRYRDRAAESREAQIRG